MLYRTLTFCLLALCLCSGRSLGQQNSSSNDASQEMRGLWVVRTSITSPSAINRVVSLAVSHHFNALFVQVRGRGDAFYRSALEPRAEELSLAPADFDPLAEVVVQAHAAGLQVHAWMNTCYVWGASHKPFSSEHVVNAHPDWLARDARGRFQLQSGAGCEGAFMTPANLAARQHIHDVFLDVVRRYNIDGIHFDYVRYANGSYDYSDAALKRFKTEMQPMLSAALAQALTRRSAHGRLAYPHAFPERWQEFRRRQVTEMVAGISQDAKRLKPWMIVSAAVFADSRDALSSRGQDWKNWLHQGYLDAVIPMAYGASTPQVAAQIADAVSCARASGRHAYAGLGSWHIPARSTLVKVGVTRALGAQGWVLFSYGGITHDGRTTAYLDAITAHCSRSSAPIPSMPWLPPSPSAQKLEAPIIEKTGG